LAVHGYVDTFKHFPPAGGEAEPASPKLTGMSWRAHLLPFLDDPEREVRTQDVYQKLVEGKYPLAPGAPASAVWNRPDLAKVNLFPFSSPRPGKAQEAWQTAFRVFVGNGAAFERDKQIKFPRDFPDGSSNTILIVEAAETVPWTKPEELPYDP